MKFVDWSTKLLDSSSLRMKNGCDMADSASIEPP